MLSQNFTSQSSSSSMQNSSTGAGNQEQHLRAQLELLKNHEAAGSLSSSAALNARDQRSAHAVQASPPRPSNGYDIPASAQEPAHAPVAKSDADSHIHPDLRGRIGHAGHAPTATMMPIAPPSGHTPGPSPGPPPQPGLAPLPPPQAPTDPGHLDGRRAKRELSQSKRAAQNRAAQRAFRQRKESYIKKLESQVRDAAELDLSYKTIQAENYGLRQYVVQLQARLVEVSGQFPEPPPNVNVSQPPAHHQPPTSAPEAPPNNNVVGQQLEAVAQAVAGLAAHEQMAERQAYPGPSFKPEPLHEDTRSAEEINRQLQPPPEGSSGPPV